MLSISLNVALGINKLLNDLDVDNWHQVLIKKLNRILNYHATEIAQILQVIFIQSLTLGNLPEDCS